MPLLSLFASSSSSSSSSTTTCLATTSSSSNPTSTARDDTNMLVVSFLAFLATSVPLMVATRRTIERQRNVVNTNNNNNNNNNNNSLMKDLPKEVVKYSQVPKDPKRFTATTIPKGLLKEHNTKAGTWGVIRVFQGQLRYQINEGSKINNDKDNTEQQDSSGGGNDDNKSVHILTPTSRPGIIEPKVKHEVAPLTDDLEFVVEFYRLPNTGPVDEKREGL